VPTTQVQVAAGVQRLRDGLGERGMASEHGASWLSAAEPTSSHGAVELFAPLTSGGTVRMTTKALPEAISEMRALISAGQVTHLYTAPLVAASVLDGCRCERPVCVVVASQADTSMTSVLVGWPGENVRVIEAVEVGGVFGPVGFGGIPAAGVSLHVVDQMARPIPLGVPGELCVGLGGTDAAELVHTGRAARVGDDGTVEILGAIGGYHHTRELIEMLPAVRDCRIVVRADGGSRPRGQLVCYARIEADAVFEPDYISTLLSERRTPRHLIPDAVVVVNEWPLTASGDVDLAALPQPADLAAAGQADGAPPWDEQFERILREVFGDTFAQAAIEPDVPLADAGLTSVGMVSLLVAIEEEYQVVIPDEFEVVDAFRTPRTLWRQIGMFRQEQQV
jgi:acyl carrier protein